MIRKRPLKIIASFLAVNLFFSAILPNAAFALTSGPSQPEVQSFEPIGTTDMVNLFTGDFSYNIPLFELPGPNGGYPFNLAYNAGIGMDQEASWVGLGWNLNAGAINRQMRGVPDEFKGDKVERILHTKPNVTIGGELSGDIEVLGKGDVNIGRSIFYNSHRGVGSETSVGVKFHKTALNSMTIGAGVNFSLNSQDGASFSPSLSLEWQTKMKDKLFKGASIGGDVGFSYNSMAGLSKITSSLTLKTRGDAFNPFTTIRAGATLHMTPAYSPQVTMPTKGLNLSANVKPGGEIFPASTNVTTKIFYNSQTVNAKLSAPSYGYLYYQDATYDAMLDFNRERESMIRKDMTNLPIPSLTPDIYSVNGQGISAMYRPFRRDIGTVWDQKLESKSSGHSVGAELGGGQGVKIGVNYGNNGSTSTTTRWNSSLELLYSFKPKKNYKDENVYFKVYGESSVDKSDANTELYTANGLSNNLALRPILKDGLVDFEIDPKQLLNKHRLKIGNPNDNLPNEIKEAREERTTSIVQITNEELLSSDELPVPVLEEYDFQYIDENGTLQDFHKLRNIEKGRAPHHLAGFTTTNSNGLRYTFALPVYNKEQHNRTYSVEAKLGDAFKTLAQDNPDSYKKSNRDWYNSEDIYPDHAYAYLLTSVLGADYVDADGIDGPSKGDLGYWVKFTYKLADGDYKWRSPFVGGKYIPGFRNTGKDDKASYSYGQKEVWYLAQVETASHVAVFNTENRKDGRGAKDAIQYLTDGADVDGRDMEGYQQKLMGIDLYTRYEFEKTQGNKIPLKKVRFDYDYSLCKGVHNNEDTGVESGKLTLKKLWFEYGRSSRGSLTPYKFEYYDGGDYAPHQTDRWGNYKYAEHKDKTPYNEEDYFDFPYVEQERSTKEQHDLNAQAWNLSKIHMPSGGVVEVEYEADDYAYVQNKTAMYMADIVGFGNVNTDYTTNVTGLSNIADTDNRKVFFKLKKPLDVNAFDTYKKQYEEALKYIDTEHNQLYFKSKMFLQNSSLNSNQIDFVAGYVDVEDIGAPDADGNAPANPTIGLGGDGTMFTHGFLTVKAVTGEKDEDENDRKYHPFAVTAWSHIQGNQPDLLSPKVDPINPSDKDITKVKKIVGILTAGFVSHIKQMTRGFYPVAQKWNWGEQIIEGKSWMRLNVSDKTKFGGGHRVKKITLSDEWNKDGLDGQAKVAKYGQVYQYTTQEADNAPSLISSGVAAYEPLHGGDEIALKYTKKYTEEVKGRNDNSYFFEYPINESYYPGAHVGYSKVTVMSLASADAKNYVDETPIGFHGTTGITVQEFYTAKDFPVITDETDIDYKVSTPIFLSGFINNKDTQKAAAVQGYSITLNDMHGKPKSVYNYGQNPEGDRLPNPISWMKYHYKKTRGVVKGKEVEMLDNMVKVLVADADKENGLVTDNRVLGQDYEFFADSRKSITQSHNVGVQGNLDINGAGLPIPIPTSYPAISESYTSVQTMVLNKVVHKVGILESIEAFNDGAVTITTNELWDALTGEVVLTSVNTSFTEEDGSPQKIYSYAIPAHLKYEGMGAAYETIGMKFKGQLTQMTDYNENYYMLDAPKDVYNQEEPIITLENELYPGDEFILSNGEARATYVGIENGKMIFFLKDAQQDLIDLNEVEFFLYRTGKRNLLGAKVGNITSFEDPIDVTKRDSKVEESEEFEIPKRTN